jgi:hypothetical protein
MSKSPTPLVEVTPIITDVQVTGEHVVALLVSQVDENILAREQETIEKIDILNKATGMLDETNAKELKDFVAKKEQQLKKSGILDALKQIGVSKPSITVARDLRHDFSGFFFVITIGSDHERTLTYFVKTTIPKKMTEITAQIKVNQAEADALTTYLLDLRSYRQNSMTGLERWARGQIAASALKRAGGDMAQFVKQLESIMPKSLKNLLTE